MASFSLEEKKKLYLKVAGYLAALTAIELVFVYAPIPSTLQTILICIASLLKAVCVGWWYMHLNHETNALKALAILPFVIAFFYATYLVVDSKYTWNRAASPYTNAPAKVFKGGHHENSHDEAQPIQKEEAAPEGEESEATEADEWN
ncbi:cytochrome C oxidase subunit IV family protein [bacterium]|nr:cytochrome C oxidase subunit IV family protein [bacterium]